MPSFNRVFLMGNLTRDPQLKYLPSQTAVAEFGLAMNRKFKTGAGEEREEVTFVDCAAFGKTADTINQYFTKGKPIFIEGRLKYDSWDDKQGGGKRSRLTVVVENFQFIGDRQGGGGGDSGGGDPGGGAGRSSSGGGGGYSNRRPPQQQSRGGAGPFGEGRRSERQAPPEPPFGDNQEFKEEDIPF